MTSTLSAIESPPLPLVSVTVRAADVAAGAVNTSTVAAKAPESGLPCLLRDVHVNAVPELVTVWVTLPELDAHKATRRLFAGAVKLAVAFGVVPVTIAGVEASIAIATPTPRHEEAARRRQGQGGGDYARVKRAIPLAE